MKNLFADIALPVPLDHPFTYLVPRPLVAHARVGSRVIVPFGRKQLTGVIVSLSDSSSVKGIKPIQDVLDVEPSFSQEMMKLLAWISAYYLAPVGEVFKAAMPMGLTIEGKQTVRLVAPDPHTLLAETAKKAPQQHKLLSLLVKDGELSVRQLQRRGKIKSIHSVMNPMIQHGWLLTEVHLDKPKVKPKLERVVALTQAAKEILSIPAATTTNITSRQTDLLRAIAEREASSPAPVSLQGVLRSLHCSLSIAKALEAKGLITISEREVIRSPRFDDYPPARALTLTTHQQNALQAVLTAVESQTYKTFLLHGITASGKTQVYIESMRQVLARGKNAIVLVPEISLTPQTVRRFKSHFGEHVAVMHSQMSAGERYDAWRLAREGRVKIVIGPRSAIFAPLENLGLIVVDEEHEASYKQFDSTPRYHARDTAIVRAHQAQAVVILGSATPSAESYQNVLGGKYELLELPERVDNAELPQIEIVDMTVERKRLFEEIKATVKADGVPFPKRLPLRSISRLLVDEIRKRMEKQEGVILLQNRRGYSHVVECLDCGFVEKCDHCEVTLTYHTTKKHLRCHYCGFVKAPPAVCPSCNGPDVRFHSLGTQQVEEEIREILADARVIRMDLDTTSRKGAHDRFLLQFERGEADILLGTQMVAKGLDFPRVTLVGVVSADTQMLLPDFRASERTFHLLTQVAGRSGRSALAGEVVIQTRQPDHYSLRYVATHDYHGFYKEELAYRRELDYPPFSRIVLVEFKGEHENEVQHHAKKFAEILRTENTSPANLILGPADAAISKIKKNFRKHVIIKNLKAIDSTGAQLRTLLSRAREDYRTSAPGKTKGVTMTIDVDPQGMM